MITILSCVIIALLICIIYQYQTKKGRNKDLAYITNKLEQLKASQSRERILLTTGDKQLIELLDLLNQLVDDHQEHARQYLKMKASMKRMLANVSHDLKTPLTVIAGYIEMLQNQPLMNEQERARLLQQVHSKTLELITLMNTFFDLAKLESGDQDIPLEKVNVTEICKNNILLFYEWIQNKGLEVVIEIPEKPVFALGNEEALNRVLTNLISNGIRYGADGKMIGLKVFYDVARVYVEVFDKGKGINEIEQERVFERMFTLEESRNKAFQGSGLGLTITKRLVEEMQGDISIQSIPFEKTSFTFSLKRLNK
ncbi:histidine kinase [Heyndrickxia shackletonii]|uniref:histidine kinase n=1 Tax=Heyndrickxia shackletonii TaxID=157838 RepID=A0A0Q3TMT5_9BACI|nr:sensor histidine kinase [Heyndrickxia shackletonii]KQL55057.1 histidine kinase [Heyndrickxia shackletonii]MBB2481173.1 sensor histidine kinase [Bacillus sp. APMAM]NEZ01398.1 HAMP domain-containing histidine kinase [Heyndrickxia shackletonii]RTZ55424.1 HAMP domain-containing histidine kinase [Bacillus sp. SAJ1]